MRALRSFCNYYTVVLEGKQCLNKEEYLQLQSGLFYWFQLSVVSI